MGKSNSSAPAAPDPYATAAAQASANSAAVRESALMNQIGQNTPYGNLFYSGEIGSPDRAVNTTLAPAQQAMLDQQNAASLQYGEIANKQLGAVADQFSSPADFSSLGGVPQAGQEAWQNSYDALVARNQPRADRQLSAMQTQLSNQGLDAGSAAYGTAMEDYNRGQNDFGLAAQQAAMGQQAQQYGLDSAAYSQGLGALMAERNQPLNELAALASGQQIQNPAFQGQSNYNVGAAPIADSIYGNYQGQMNAFNQSQANDAANRQGLYDLLGTGATAAMMFSDRRLKRNIKRIGEINNLPVYTWNYIWGLPGVGHMSDEVREVRPDAVHTVGGFDMVDYGALAWR
tara:strand:- start:112 stop:1146 length:1035 start_codon:yes stop_codon:yes gene_type:complete